MRLPFGIDVALSRRDRSAALSVVPKPEPPSLQAAVTKALQAIFAQSSQTQVWWPIRESFTGAWQQNVTLDAYPGLLAFSAVFCCVTGIAADVAKCRIKLSENNDEIWTEKKRSDFDPHRAVLEKPNHFQNRIQFLQQWVVSKLLHGSAYMLKVRDARGIVTSMYVLDPQRVTPLVADNGDIYYELRADFLSRVSDTITIPAREIIHDRMVGFWHPLVGISPLYACAMTATMGNRIQSNSTNLFANAARPGGVLTAPGHIPDDTAARLQANFEANFSGANVGKLAVLGDGLKFEPMAFAPEVMQLIEQLKWTVEDVARAFHYPLYKLGGPMPPYSAGPEVLSQMYYNDCLQVQFEDIELCLREGLELKAPLEIELDLENLMRMDTGAMYDALNKAEKFMTTNEMRFRANYPGVKGGNTIYRQRQDYPIETLSGRKPPDDTMPAPGAPTPTSTPSAPDAPAVDKGFEWADLEAFAVKAFES